MTSGEFVIWLKGYLAAPTDDTADKYVQAKPIEKALEQVKDEVIGNVPSYTWSETTTTPVQEENN